MKYLINILLLFFVFFSCKEPKKNELNETIIFSKEKKSFPIEPVSQNEIMDTLNNRKLIANKIKLTLPTPDSAFFNNSILPNENADLIEKYIKMHFIVTHATKVIETTSTDHPEGVWDCHIRTEYGSIALEEYTCDLQLEKTVEFKNYSFKEVIRILKILYPEVKNKTWNDNSYVYDSDEGYGCSMEINNINDKILVSYGCSN